MGNHSPRHREIVNARYRRLREAGICTLCGAAPGVPGPKGGSPAYCEPCRERVVSTRARYYERNRERIKADARARYAARKDTSS